MMLVALFLLAFSSQIISNEDLPLNFKDYWHHESFLKTIPTGNDRIFVYTVNGSGSRSMQMRFFSDTSCSSLSAIITVSDSFTNGQVWYLSGAALTSYVNANSFSFGTQSAAQSAGSFVLRDATHAFTGNCTTSMTGNNPYQSSGTVGSLTS